MRCRVMRQVPLCVVACHCWFSVTGDAVRFAILSPHCAPQTVSLVFHSINQTNQSFKQVYPFDCGSEIQKSIDSKTQPVPKQGKVSILHLVF